MNSKGSKAAHRGEYLNECCEVVRVWKAEIEGFDDARVQELEDVEPRPPVTVVPQHSKMYQVLPARAW